jgi:N-acetylglucosamine-6-phosphate deacetylase
MMLIKNVKYFNGEQFIDNSNIVVANSKIVKIFSGKQSARLSDYEKVIDGEGDLLVPGFIDIHLHGCGGCDVMDGKTESIEKIASTLAKNGTTSFLPTTVTMPAQATQKAISAIRTCMSRNTGASILGIHLEGPFINKARKGAQNENYILEPSIQNFNEFVNGNLQDIKRVTLAPETGDGIALVKYLTENNICVSAGHTCASAEIFDRSVNEGLTLCTHLFNGMNPLHHRDPGVVGSALLNDDVYTEFIADLVHIDKTVLKLIIKIKGMDKCILVTDSLSAACLGNGIFNLGGQTVIVKNGVARIENGSLAGSVITMKEAVKNMVKTVGVDICSVLKMATINPARVIGADAYKGKIKEGHDADINLMNENLDIDMTMVMGRIVQNRYDNFK